MAELLVEMSGIEKSFPGVHALIDARFELRPGEVHALVLGDRRGDPSGEGDAAALDPDEGEGIGAVVPFDNFIRHARDGALERFGTEDDRRSRWHLRDAICRAAHRK